MRTRNTGFIAGLLGLAALVLGTGSPVEVNARPQYKEVFESKYPALAAEVNKVKCGVCHPPSAPEKKKVRNNYGQALGKTLGEANVQNKDVIMKALTTIETQKSETEGKTFGDLIKAGTLPGKNE